jgi:8-oxo-dGTP diphosphatase
MPGGGVHKHETFEQAAIREIKEETGYSITQLDYLLGIYENKKEGKNDIIHCFVVELPELIDFSKNKFNFEISDIKWVEINTLPTQTSRATCDRIKEYLNKNISQAIRSW